MTSILLAEDDEDIRLLVEEVLIDAGYNVDTADTVAGRCRGWTTRATISY